MIEVGASTPSAAWREKFVAASETTSAFGIVTSSFRSVVILVDSVPSWVTVPSTSPILTKSPTRTAREKVTIRPLITWFMMPVEPSEIISPRNTLTPLKASELAPGRNSYQTTSAKIQSSATAMRRVGCAVSGYTPGSDTRPSSTIRKANVTRRTAKRVNRTITTTVTRLGR